MAINNGRPLWSSDGRTLTNVLLKDTNLYGTYNVTDTWYNGELMDDEKLDSDLVYVKYQDKYLVQNFEYGQILQKDTMEDMRNLSSKEILLLKMGVYKHIQLNGYYKKNDTPSPIEYKLSNTALPDDGFSIIEVNSVKLEHEFIGDIFVEYAGCVGDGTTDSTQGFKRINNYIRKFNTVASNPQSGDLFPKPLFNIIGNSPQGYLITDSIEFSKVDAPAIRNYSLTIGIFINSKIIWAGSSDKTAVTIAGCIGSDINIKVYNKGQTNLDFSSLNFQGVVLENITRSNINISVSGFTRNIVAYAKSRGFAWNTINIGVNRNSLQHFVIKSTEGGWPNANTINGGDWSTSSGAVAPNSISSKHIFILGETDGQYQSDSWKFDSLNIEGRVPDPNYNGQEALAFDFSNLTTNGFVFRDCRVETINNTKLGIVNSKSRNFNWDSGVEVSNSIILDETGARSTFGNLKQNEHYIVHSEKFPKTSILKSLNGKNYLKGNRETYKTGTGFNIVDSPSYFFDLFSLQSEVLITIAKQDRIRIVLFDENMIPISDTATLNRQISQMWWNGYSDVSYWAINTSIGVPNIGAVGDRSASNKVFIKTIPEAKYIGILQPIGQNNYYFTEVGVFNGADGNKLQKVYYDKTRSGKEGIIIIDLNLNSKLGYVNAGEHYYSVNTNTYFIVTKSGQIGGHQNSWNLTSNSNTISLSSGTISNTPVGSILSFANDSSKNYEIISITGNNAVLDKPVSVGGSGVLNIIKTPEITQIPIVSATTTVKGLVNQGVAVPNGSSIDTLLTSLRNAGIIAT